MQTTFGEKKVKYSYGPYNKVGLDQQWIRITEGCPNNCPYCYEPTEIKVFDIPTIERNIVKIMDMNLLCKPQALDIIKELGQQKVDGHVVYYELICGIDYRFLTSKIAEALKASRFSKIRLAWDGPFKKQRQIKAAIEKLLNAGYTPNQIMVFMICNHYITFRENLSKLDLCKVWNVQVADCYFDNQVSPDIIPIHWNADQIRRFRAAVRKHNQLVNFRIDPECPA